MATVTNTYTVSFPASLAGTVARSSVNESFSTIRSGAGTTTSSSFLFASLTSSGTTNQFQSLSRSIILFNTSSIPSTATITSAYVSVVGNNTGNALGSTNIFLVSSNPASTSSLSASDYSTLGTTSYGSIAFASFFPTGTNIFTMNATGIGTISKGGVSKFGLILGWDSAGSFSGSWVNTQTTNYTIEVTQVSLVVTYTVDFPTLSVNNISSLSNVTTITTS